MKEYLYSLRRSKTTTLRRKKSYAFSDNIVSIIALSNRCELRIVGNPFPTIRLRLNPVQLYWLTLLISNEGRFALTSSKQLNNLSADKTENSSEVIESIIGNHNQCELQSLEIHFVETV